MKGDNIAEIIKPIVRLDYDEILARTDINLYKGIPVNFNHIPDTEIGKVLSVYADSKDPNLIIARMFIKDEVWEKYGNEFGGCSVEVAFNSDMSIVIPTQVSILSKDLPPAIKDTNKFTLEKYSKEDKEYLKAYYSWDGQNKEENTIDKIYNMLKEIFKSVKPNTGLKIIDDDWNWDKEKVVIEAYCTNKDGSFDWEKYKKFFAYYDENEPNKKESYKFPHHTIRDGEMVLVKKALYAGMAYLNGARGTKIKEEIRQDVYKHLSKHYIEDLKEKPPILKELKSKGDEDMDETKYTEIMNKLKELEAKYSEIVKEKVVDLEPIKKEYSEKIEVVKSEYAKELEEIKKEYSEKVAKCEEEIEVIKSEYSKVKKELNTLKEKYGLTEGEEINDVKKYEGNRIVMDIW